MNSVQFLLVTFMETEYCTGAVDDCNCYCAGDMLMIIDDVRLQLMTHTCAGVFAVCGGGQLLELRLTLICVQVLLMTTMADTVATSLMVTVGGLHRDQSPGNGPR